MDKLYWVNQLGDVLKARINQSGVDIEKLDTLLNYYDQGEEADDLLADNPEIPAELFQDAIDELF